LPLEVLSTVCGGASTISSGGSPMAATTAFATASRNAVRAEAGTGRASASTTRRSVPVAGSGLPKTATQPLRTPSTWPTASSISCGYRLRPPRITMSFTRPVMTMSLPMR
jgi:hypothetical protein